MIIRSFDLFFFLFHKSSSYSYFSFLFQFHSFFHRSCLSSSISKIFAAKRLTKRIHFDSILSEHSFSLFNMTIIGILEEKPCHSFVSLIMIDSGCCFLFVSSHFCCGNLSKRKPTRKRRRIGFFLIKMMMWVLSQKEREM